MKKRAPSDPLTVDDVTQPLTAWAAALGCTPQTIMGRLDRGWDPKRAVTKAIGQGGSNRGKKLPPEILTHDELLLLLEQCSDRATGIRNRALIVIGWRSGLRIAEAIALMPKDLDEKGQTVRVLHGKGDKSRTVGLDREAWAIVKKWIEVRSILHTNDSTPLFCTMDGDRLMDRYVRALMKRLAAAAGITKRVHFHGLRHTHAFELSKEHVALNVIQKLLGHKNAKITSEYLDHVGANDAADTAKTRIWSRSGAVHLAGTGPNCVPPPDWADRLKADIGPRLQVFHDARVSDNDDFRVVVLIYPERTLDDRPGEAAPAVEPLDSDDDRH